MIPTTLLPERTPRSLRIELVSDAAIGRGAMTFADVDAEVEQDDLGLPFLGGKTLHGLLRDAWLQMADCFDELQTAASAVLGEEGSTDADTAVRVGNAELPAAVRARVSERDIDPNLVLESLTVRRSQTARERDGRPRRGSLRTTRAVRRGTVLHAPLLWRGAAGATDDEIAVLALAARGVRALGGSRNRGLGRVTVRAVHESVEPWVVTPDLVGRGTPNDASEVAYLPISLYLDAPVLMARIGGGSLVRTWDRVKGSAIRGAVAAACRSDVAALDRLVLSDDVLYLDAHPLPEARTPVAQPLPIGWRVRKKDRALDSPELFDLLGEEAMPDENLTRPGEGWHIEEQGTAQGITVARSARLHHARDRVAGRAWTRRGRRAEDEQPMGALFAYESLDRGQAFAGAIALAGPAPGRAAIAHELRALLDGTDLLIGRSRAAGYGGVARVAVGELVSRVGEGDGTIRARDSLQPETRFRARLLSPYVGRDPRSGQIDPAWLGGELEARLGGRARVLEVAVRPERLGGFDRHWRMPTPAVLAAAAGGEAVLEAVEALAGSELERIAARGIGEQREVGCGRVGWYRDDAAPSAFRRSAALGRRAKDMPLLDDATRRVLHPIEEDIVAELLKRRVESLAADLADAFPTNRLPSRALLGRLRLAFGDPSWQSTLKIWLNREHADALKQPARRQLERARLDGSANLAAGRVLNAAPTARSLDGLLRLAVDGTLAKRLDIEAVAARVALDTGRLAQASHASAGEHVRALLKGIVDRLAQRASEADRG